MTQILEELNKLRLDILSQEWVESIYDSEFLEIGDIPTEHESILESLEIKSVFRNIMKACDSWLNPNLNSEDEKSWSVLSHQIKHKNLLSFLAFYINNGSKNVLTKEHRNNSILASQVYYKLLLIPGYKAYHIYHSQLFAQSLACLSYPKAMCDNEDNYFSTKELSREVNILLKKLGHFVNDLKAIIEKLQLTPQDMNFEDIMSNLVDITGGAIVNKLNIDKIELASVSKVIYEMIDTLICGSSGNPNASAIQVLYKCLLPKLISSSVDCRNANNVVRASYVTYSGLLLTKYGKVALSGYMVLLQHLCYTLEGLERAEVRGARVSLVFGLMSLLPPRSYKKMIMWLINLSSTSKISHRQLALEMIAKLLNNEPELPASNPGGNSSENKNNKVNQNENGNTPSNNLPQSETPDGMNGDGQTQDTLNGDGQTQDTLNDNEEAAAGEGEEGSWGPLRGGSPAAPLSALVSAVYSRVQDSSGSLRTRALSLLGECVWSPRPALREALAPLCGGPGGGPEGGPGGASRLAAAGARGACDERAVVRRAAAGLLLRLLGAGLGREGDYAILVGLCRDASVLVRSCAVSSLGELVAQAPDQLALDAFLSGPLHQLSDPETKVQEQVVSLIQQLLMGRLQKYDPNAAEDPLPWLFLAGITRHNMRRHLQKACTLLVKSSNCINHRLVDSVSTHLGALEDERDLQCLVLLSSLARHVDYHDANFLLDYYYHLTDTQGRDARLLPLLLELLAAWSRWLTDKDRVALREHLVARLAAATDDGCRTACACLAAQLDPENLLWATELMQISERRALGGSVVREWLRAADVSLVAPAPPSPRLLRLFLNALTDPPPEWCAEELGACVAGAGRLCVRSREAAAALAPALARLLRRAAGGGAPAPANALLALTDICTRYSCIVEPLMESVCGCLSPGAAPQLRRSAASCLTRLLLAGYLRLRTPLYYRYCALLADEDQDVREPAEYYVSCCLTVDAIYHHFVDCVLHYNKEDSEKISFDSRQLIYDVMLQRMSLVQKLNVQCRLAREVLEHAADVCDDTRTSAADELPPALHAALLDSITLLCGPRMKLPKKPEKAGDNDIEDLQERVTTNIVSHKMKRTVAEVLVPGVLRLYAALRPGGGQLAAYLVRLATDLLSDYRHEIEELIENDEELVTRVQQFQETIGSAPSFGNSRNLVTSSAPPDPDTPRARKRPAAAHSLAHTHAHRKRTLRI